MLYRMGVRWLVWVVVVCVDRYKALEIAFADPTHHTQSCNRESSDRPGVACPACNHLVPE